MTEGRFISITNWQDKTFPNSTALSKVEHLKQECEELYLEIVGFHKANHKAGFELADCLILLYGVAAKLGLSYDDINNVIDDKMKINMERKWGEPDANGVVNHIKTSNQ